MASIFSFTDLFDVFVLDQFRYVLRFDMKVMLAAPVDRDEAVAELSRMKGVQMAEPLLEIPATLVHGHRSKDTVIIANAPDAELYTVIDKDNGIVTLPDEGIILCLPLAKKLEAEVGDLLELESPYQENKDLSVTVVGIIPQYIGSNAYMSQDALNRLLGQGDIATSVLLRVGGDRIASLKEALLLGKTVSGVDDIKQTQQGYVTLLDQFFFMVWIMVAMVILVGFAIVYNSSVISLSERERELASLRVLGMDLREVQEVISFEQHFLAVFGMLLGIPLTYMMFKGMADGMQTDLYTIPVIINPRMFIYALIGTAGSLALAYLNIRKRLRRLDMVEVLKSRE
jgi:putative ABC transport system permease protein